VGIFVTALFCGEICLSLLGKEIVCKALQSDQSGNPFSSQFVLDLVSESDVEMFDLGARRALSRD